MKMIILKVFFYLSMLFIGDYLEGLILSSDNPSGLLSLCLLVYVAYFLNIDIKFLISLEAVIVMTITINFLLPENMRFLLKGEDIRSDSFNYFFWQLLITNIFFMTPLIFDFLVKRFVKWLSKVLAAQTK
jgi:hypothetical protein